MGTKFIINIGQLLFQFLVNIKHHDYDLGILV